MGKGKDGSKKHAFIIEIVRSLSNAILRYKGNEDFACICAEPLCHLIDQGKRKGARYPDVMFIQKDYYPIMVEVGKYQVSKWRCPVIHIEFDKTITTINWISTRFTEALLRAVTIALECVNNEDDLEYYMVQIMQG